MQRSAGLPETGFHITRHTFCSHLAMQGVPASAIQALAGHADLSTTQRYMHLAPSALDDAIAALCSVLEDGPAAEIPSPGTAANPARTPRRGHSLGTSEGLETNSAP